MNYFLIQAVLIANIGDEESSFWMQILVFLLVAVIWGVYSFSTNNRSKYKDQQHKNHEKSWIPNAKSLWRFGLRGKSAASGKGIVQEYITKMETTRGDEPGLSQKLKFNFDSLDTGQKNSPRNKPTTRKNRDLESGMELLELNFLLSVVENTKGDNQNDVTMRKLNFNEVARREKLSQVNSKALTVYTIDRGNLYGKDIQCKAMGQLAERTTRGNRNEALRPAVSPKRRGRIVDV